ncbi:MAG: helix-turn-helix domain-containing protein [Acidobacteria bacterium]|nr:helix-turn-helix domain-containing protein [Acidobacteriota bacterium]
MSTTEPTPHQFPSLVARQVAERIGVSEATLFRLLARGAAPPSYKIAKRRLWREIDVIDWLERECRDEGRAAG